MQSSVSWYLIWPISARKKWQYGRAKITNCRNIDDNDYYIIIIIEIVMTVINGSSGFEFEFGSTFLPILCHLLIFSSSKLPFSPAPRQTHKSLYNRLGCVVLSLRWQPNDLRLRGRQPVGGQTNGWTVGRIKRGTNRMAGSWFLCLYFHIFYLLAFRNLFYICFTWNDRDSQLLSSLCFVLLSVVVVVCPTPISAVGSSCFRSSVCPSLVSLPVVCLCVWRSVNAAGNWQRLVLLFSGVHVEKSFEQFAC